MDKRVEGAEDLSFQVRALTAADAEEYSQFVQAADEADNDISLDADAARVFLAMLPIPVQGIFVSGVLAGVVILTPDEHHRNQAEVSYHLSEEFRRKRIMTSALNRVLLSAYGRFKSFKAYAREDNVESQGVLRHNGFKESGFTKTIGGKTYIAFEHSVKE